MNGHEDHVVELLVLVVVGEVFVIVHSELLEGVLH